MLEDAKEVVRRIRLSARSSLATRPRNQASQHSRHLSADSTPTVARRMFTGSRWALGGVDRKTEMNGQLNGCPFFHAAQRTLEIRS